MLPRLSALQLWRRSGIPFDGVISTQRAFSILRIRTKAHSARITSTSTTTMGTKSCYAVVRGRSPGLYLSWPAASAQVQGFRGNLYKGFSTIEEATRYLEDNGITGVDQHSNAAATTIATNTSTTAPPAPPPRPIASAENDDDADTNTTNALKSSNQPPPLAATAVPPHAKTQRQKKKDVVVMLQFDGASKRNPGPSALGAVLYDTATGAEIARIKQYMGPMFTNNQAEYAGLIAGLTAALELGYDKIQVRGDSTLIINQVLGVWRVKNEGLMPYHALARKLRHQFTVFHARQVPRAQNSVADALGNEAIADHVAGTSKDGGWSLEKARKRVEQVVGDGCDNTRKSGEVVEKKSKKRKTFD